MTWAVSIKMISSTSTTSTRGTMLISASEGLPRNRPRRSPLEVFREKAMLIAPSLSLQGALRQIQELELKVFHARAEFLDRAAEHIVENSCWNGGKESHRGGDQGFRDAWRYGPEAGGAGGVQLLECVDDAPDGSKQADERRDRCGCGEHVHVALQARDLFAHPELQRAFQRKRIGDAAARFHLARYFVIAKIEHHHQRRAPELFTRGGNGV